MNWHHIFIGFLIVGSLVIGGFWQAKLIKRRERYECDNFKPYAIPNYIAYALSACYAAYAIYASFDGDNPVNRREIWGNTGLLVGLSLVFHLKSTIAPLIFGISLSIASYKLMQGGTFDPRILFNLVSEAFLSWTPSWVQGAYSTLSFVSCLGSAAFAFVSDDLLDWTKRVLT